MIKGRKADGVLLGIVALLIIMIVTRDLFILKECREDDDCRGGQNCESDFKCHERSSFVPEYSLPLTVAIIIGLTFAAIILRWKRKL